ncbi:zinc finger protein C-x8-C-x5-C-x3-H type (and similar) [Teratosphaeria destructans]|uniref:mRNA 3'-end-processing protein n=1 Tax=Teratosphaeria destructans TaxID=418781 RepID=A0A9W7SJ98_9PEZI|nr:zinc finger protein C-x8-C-x5-C-x3-H type (and similar) [Teratosphaeria destructans]
MATTTSSSSLASHVLHPHSAPRPSFTFDPLLRQQFPALGAPSKVLRPICPDFRSGHCPRGPLCPDRHYTPPNERSGIANLICKHYQRGLCKKGDQCEFAHTFNLRDERECKEYSKYGICPQGDDCTYLHVAPNSRLRDPPCPHYTRGFCPLGPYCSRQHIKHPVPCPYYLAASVQTAGTDRRVQTASSRASSARIPSGSRMRICFQRSRRCGG